MDVTYFLHPARRAMGLLTYFQIFGLHGLLYAFYSLVSNKKYMVRAAERWSSTPIYLRLNSSDILVFKQVFIEEEYKVVKNINKTVRVIVDAGANIGLTSVYLKKLYPNACIIAVEPDENNMRVMRLNLEGYEQIHLVLGALWNKDELLKVKSMHFSDWAYQVTNETLENSKTVRGFRLTSLMHECGISHISLLKMDIEGAEYEVLSDSQFWCSDVDSIVLELHESIRPGCTDLFFANTKDFRFIAETKELTCVSK